MYWYPDLNRTLLALQKPLLGLWPGILHHRWDLSVSELRISGITMYALLNLASSIMFIRFTHIVLCSYSSFILTTNFILGLYPHQCIHFTTDGHLGFLKFRFTTNTAMNILVHVFLWTYITISASMPKSRINGFIGTLIFSSTHYLSTTFPVWLSTLSSTRTGLQSLYIHAGFWYCPFHLCYSGEGRGTAPYIFLTIDETGQHFVH